MSRAVDAVIEFLEAEQARGITHVLLDEEAREGLRGLYRAAARPAAKPAHAAREAAQPTSVVATLTVPAGGSKAERLATLRGMGENWQPARSTGTLRGTMVFSIGNPDASLMLVGEAPGHEEERRREPFAGPAGEKLNMILKTMGLDRENVYITNILKFRPATRRQTTNNRTPSPEEITACMPIFRMEVDIVQPQCIVALGNTAAAGLLGLADNVASLRGKWHMSNGIPVRVTHHPSYLLHSDRDLTVKRQLWEDMLAAMEFLQMPITEKQRSFFLPKNP